MATILLVEDDLDARRIIGAALAERGHRVLTANHGAEGVYVARAQRPDLVLMDLRMPVMDGLDALRYLKTDDRTARIPVWVISAYLGEEEGNALLGRFDRLVPKPIEPNDLIAMIEAHFGPRNPPQIPS